MSHVFYRTSEQYKEMSETRQLRHCKETQIVIDFLEKGSPFNGDIHLRNIANSLKAYGSASVDPARDLGLKIIDSMSGKLVVDFVF